MTNLIPGDMLSVLRQVESALVHGIGNEGPLLDSTEGWNSKYIDYHPPLVERMWRDWGDYRISLHRIHPCDPGVALLHPHPWPAAFLVLGEYELGFGYCETNESPEITHTCITSPGFRYEMTHKHAWHYVAPTRQPVLTVMVTGKPWDREAPRTANAPFRELTEEEQLRLIQDISNHGRGILGAT